MNGSHSWKMVWWGTAGCGSRTVSVFLGQAGCEDFYNYRENCNVPNQCSHTHHQGIPEGMDDYTIICNVRNPYSKCVSSYLDETSDNNHENHGLGFKEWIERLVTDHNKQYNHDHFYMGQWESIGRGADYIIRLEHMEEDMRKIPNIVKGPKFEESLFLIKKNTYKNVHPRDEYQGEFQYFQKYYTQEIADLVYDNHKEYFDLGGYDKDSWKL